MNDSKSKIVLADPMALEPAMGTIYPAPLNESSKGREKRAIGDALGLTHYGVNLVHVPPGEVSSHRHWHSKQDEFVYMLEGELTLITDAGEQMLRPGMAAGFPADNADGHCLRNDSAAVAAYLVVGDRVPGDVCSYSDIDLHGVSSDGRGMAFTRKDGSPLATKS
ncbi:MAG: cupin domain-containing protein [Rhodospirillaceae bacterium]|nr:cupin domain-containing protein [Rhodospirillaceae bacterium]